MAVARNDERGHAIVVYEQPWVDGVRWGQRGTLIQGGGRCTKLRWGSSMYFTDGVSCK